jgi:HK97 family phage portal protein/HK97 family phage prohead protease
MLRLLGWIARRLNIVEQPAELTMSHEWGQETPTPQPYDALNSMSAFGRFPWVVAAVQAVARDIAGLPYQAQRGEGERAQSYDHHPALDLLRKPASTMGSRLWREQMIVDFLLSGNAYVLMVGRPRVVSLVRLHPEKVEIITNAQGGIEAYAFGDGGERPLYSPADVIHIRGPSWRSGPEGMYGQGIVEVLEVELSGEHAASKRWKEEAGRGRPGMLITPKDEAATPPDVLQKVLARIQDQFNKFGAAAIGAAIDVHQMPFNARDMEFSQARDWSRSATLAVVGAASTRLFLPDANYATSQQQNKTYWQNLLGVIALVEDGLAEIAQRVGHPDDRITHDVSGVEALQESRTERLGRAVTLYETFGLTPLAALAAEGFDQIDESMFIPAGQPAEAAEAGAAGEVIDPTADLADQALNGAQVTALLEILAYVSDGRLDAAAAVSLILVAFPTVSEAEAQSIVSGAKEITEPDTIEARAARMEWRMLSARRLGRVVNRTQGEAMRQEVGVTLKRVKMEGEDPEQLIQSRFRFIASTADPDRMGDIVEQSWKLDAYKKNPVILWSHQSDKPPIGKAVAVEVVGGALQIEIEFDMADPFAAEVAGKIQRGFISAGSVGFMPGETQWRNDLAEDDPRFSKGWGMVLSKNELMEFSITPVPANSSALIAASAASDDELRTLLSQPDNRRRARALLGAETPAVKATPDGLGHLFPSSQATGLPFLQE